jgi:hypothetical protein
MKGQLLAISIMTLHKLPELLVVAAVTMASLLAASPAIGVASAVGTFTVNSSEVEGNANLFNGSRIQTDRASSKVYLTGGASLVLGVNSAGTIYKDHFTLNQGAAKIDNLTGYSIRADRYDIRQAKPSSQAIVRFKQGAVEIAALSGSLNVFDEKGALLTRVAAGTASAFQSGLTTLPSGASVDTNSHKRRLAYLYLLTGSALTGLGLATDAILQPSSTSP